MRAIRDLFAASCLVLSATPMAVGQVPARREPPPPPPGQGPPGQVLVVEETPAPRPFDEAEAAGLPGGTKPRVLTIQDAYSAALGDRTGVADFARVRDALLASRADAGPRFRDPTADYLDLLRKRLEVELATQRAVGLHRLLAQLNRGMGPGSGITPMTVNLVDSTLQRVKSERADRELAYRDALDAFKVRLGLPVETPIIPDATLVAPLRATFESLRVWWDLEFLARDTGDLRSILARLPKAADATIDGRSVADVATKHPEGLADLLASATRLSAGRDGLAVRSRVRRLGRLAEAVETDREELLRGLLRRDNAQRLVNAPPQMSNADTTALVSASAEALLNADAVAFEAQSRLIRDWSEGHALRIAIARDLGTLPEKDWEAFLKAFSEPGEAPKTP